MSRLTFRDSKGELWIKDAADIDEQGQICMLTDRLAAYEDIGLEPEEIKDHEEMFAAYRHVCGGKPPEEIAHAIELLEAERDGRLVVLSTPMVPFVRTEDPMDSDVYCPACGETLSGGWPKYHPDQEWKMCQCFHCGQSIDDTKVITCAEAEAALKGAKRVNETTT